MEYRKFIGADGRVSSVSVAILQIENAARQSSYDSLAQAEVLAVAADRGMNLIDLGFPYMFDNPSKLYGHFRGAVKNAHQKGSYTAINIPLSMLESDGSADRYLDEQLHGFGLDYADLCIVTGLNRNSLTAISGDGYRSWLDKILRDGRVKYPGFSFRDNAVYLRPVLSSRDDWAAVKIDYSLTDFADNPGIGGLEAVSREGLCVIVSGGLKNGRMLSCIPDNIDQIWCESDAPVDGQLLRWLLGHLTISTVSLAFASAEAVHRISDITETVGSVAPDVFEMLRLNRVRDAYSKERFIACTACRCCMPCPLGIDAPRIAELYNDFLMYSVRDIPKLLYKLEGHDKIQCTAGGTCEKVCPKHFPLIELQKRAAAAFK
ncbi:MAG: hypothetical protein GX847_02775 [Clostridiales bacterium]|nr:hypothetical protein [Clostridiales bacterium]